MNDDHWRDQLAAKREAEGTDPHAEERVKNPFMTWADETQAQRLAVHQRRAVQAVTDHPDWSDERLGDEWGISPALVAEARSQRDNQGTDVKQGEPETYAQRVAAELNEPSQLARALAALKRAMGRQ